MDKYKIGYNQLDSEARRLYEVLYDGFMKYRFEIEIAPVFNSINIVNVIRKILSDYPEIIYFNKSSFRLSQGFFSKKLILTSVESKMKTMIKEKELNKTVTDICNKIKERYDSGYDSIRGVYEYLQKNVNYDHEALNRLLNGKKNNGEVHNAYGALVNGKAVCDGISSAFALLVNKMGYECMSVSGESLIHGNGFSKHAWNIIKYDNEFFHVDLTWDIGMYAETGEYSYQYLGLRDTMLFYSHEWDFQDTPLCESSKLSYYFRNNLYANNETQLEDIFLREVKKGKSTIRLQLSLKINLPEDEQKYLENKVIELSLKTRNLVRVCSYWNENIRCLFVKLLD